MLVKDLIKELQPYKNMELVISTDEEGNGFYKDFCVDNSQKNKLIIFPIGELSDYVDGTNDNI